MKKLYQRTFDQVLAQTGPDPARTGAQRAALASHCSPHDLEVCTMTKRKKTIRTLLVAAAVIAALTVGALAASGALTIPFLSGGGITQGVDENGNSFSSTTVSGQPLSVEDGRLYLTNEQGERLDLTDQLSQEEPYVYTYQDADGNTHDLVVGGTVENYGSFEFAFDAGGLFMGGGGGFPAGYDSSNPPAWLTAYKDSRNLPI